MKRVRAIICLKRKHLLAFSHQRMRMDRYYKVEMNENYQKLLKNSMKKAKNIKKNSDGERNANCTFVTINWWTISPCANYHSFSVACLENTFMQCKCSLVIRQLVRRMSRQGHCTQAVFLPIFCTIWLYNVLYSDNSRIFMHSNYLP